MLGHWNDGGYGCDVDMAVGNLYEELSTIPVCTPVASKMKYVMGHTHINDIVEDDIGFIVAGQGMSQGDQSGDFGLPVFDTTDGRFRVFYFSFAKKGENVQVFDKDAYDEILDCIQVNGISNCYSLAEVWSDLPLPE